MTTQSSCSTSYQEEILTRVYPAVQVSPMAERERIRKFREAGVQRFRFINKCLSDRSQAGFFCLTPTASSFEVYGMTASAVVNAGFQPDEFVFETMMGLVGIPVLPVDMGLEARMDQFFSERETVPKKIYTRGR